MQAECCLILFKLKYQFFQMMLLYIQAYGVGSACGKNMMKETFDLLGNQKKLIMH